MSELYEIFQIDRKNIIDAAMIEFADNIYQMEAYIVKTYGYYLETIISELETKNSTLLEALEDWNKSFKSVLDHGVYFDNNVFTLFNQRYVQSEKAIAEALQGDE